MEQTVFAEIRIGEPFLFATKHIDRQRICTKEEEMRRPYTPEAWSNASFGWNDTPFESGGRTFFYVTPTTTVFKLD